MWGYLKMTLSILTINAIIGAANSYFTHLQKVKPGKAYYASTNFYTLTHHFDFTL